MTRTRMISLLVALSVTAASGVAMAQPAGRGRDRQMFLLARAAGLTRTQIVTAFKNDSTNLKADRTALQTARQSLAACLVTGKDCSTQAGTFLGAQQTMAKEKLSVWQGLFQAAPNPGNAATVLGQLQQLQAQRKQIFQQVFAGGGE